MGALAPIGQTIQFIEAEANRVKVAITTWRASLEQRLEVRAVGAYPACLTSLEPLEWPWTRELIVDAGPWTLYMNNQKNGGDSSSCAGVISKMLEVRCVTVHQPRTPVGHASTQFWINRPGETPSQHRVLAAHAEDGRWE